MSVGDVFLLIVRWIHLVAAAAWVGGSVFYLLILRPVSNRTSGGSNESISAVAAEFRGLVDICIVALVATGAILSLERLAGGVADVPFAVTLGVKAFLTVWMFYLTYSLRRRRDLGSSSAIDAPVFPILTNRLAGLLDRHSLIVILGVVVFLVSDLLKVLYEIALVGD